MRRIYYMPKKQRPAIAEALRQMRETQLALGPEFITRIKMLVKDFDPDSLVLALTPEKAVEDQSEDMLRDEIVDKKKNLLIIMKFLQIKQGNKSVQTQVRTLLSESTTIQ